MECAVAVVLRVRVAMMMLVMVMAMLTMDVEWRQSARDLAGRGQDRV